MKEAQISNEGSGEEKSSKENSVGDGAKFAQVLISRPESGDTRESRRPVVGDLVRDFVSSVPHGPTTVLVSGPLGMTDALRSAVAGQNEGSKVWRGDSKFDVRLVYDDRIEW